MIDSCQADTSMMALQENQTVNRNGNENMMENSRISFRAFPNPFYQTTSLEYYLPEEQSLSIRVVNMTGQLVTSIFSDEEVEAGYYQYQLDASLWSPGIYLVVLEVEGERLLKKLVLTR